MLEREAEQLEQQCSCSSNSSAALDQALPYLYPSLCTSSRPTPAYSLSLSLPVRSPALDSLPRVLGLVALACNMSHNRTAQGVFVGRARGSSPPPTWGGSPGHPPSPFLSLPLPSSPFLSLHMPA